MARVSLPGEGPGSRGTVARRKRLASTSRPCLTATLAAVVGLAIACGGSASPSTGPVTTYEALATPTAQSDFQRAHFKTELDLTTYFPDGTRGGFAGEVEGDFVAPNSYSVVVDFFVPPDEGEAVRAEAVLIGDRAWKRVRADEWVPTDPLDPVIGLFTNFLPVEVIQASTRQLTFIVAPMPAVQDVVAGTPALRFDLTDEAKSQAIEDPVFLQAFLGGGALVEPDAFDFSLWLSDDSERILKLEMSARFIPEDQDVPPGTEFDYSASVTLSRYDDPTIVVEPPI